MLVSFVIFAYFTALCVLWCNGRLLKIFGKSSEVKKGVIDNKYLFGKSNIFLLSTNSTDEIILLAKECQN